MKKYFNKAAKTTLILVYLVIIAGALVRMTGSGMGCPDWPKCFGYYIPPTDIAELNWAPGRTFEEGQVIIKDESLLVADGDFTTGDTFDASQWRPYTRHDYAIFNPTHTWIEYLNRLAGALAGISTFVMALLSLGYWKTNKRLTLLSWLAVILMGVQGWLGATVVYSVLNPFKITLHMLVALVIVALLLYIIHKASEKIHFTANDPVLKKLVLAALVLTLIQIVLGTQVRQFVDEQMEAVNGNLALVLENPTLDFYIHRSFSIVVFLVNLMLYIRNKKLNPGFSEVFWIMVIMVVEIITGILMYWFPFPFGFQTAHLILATLLFALQYRVWLRCDSLKSAT